MEKDQQGGAHKPPENNKLNCYLVNTNYRGIFLLSGIQSRRILTKHRHTGCRKTTRGRKLFKLSEKTKGIETETVETNEDR